ncbi:MAG: hypothetical protein EOP07_02260 [Proteobacteria bacterium]|nr:MAG: hypothetical protein EOP07_02260 [Pseudomonadota bacterium]
MESNPDPIQDMIDNAAPKPRKAKAEKFAIERDIFGQEFLGTKQILRLDIEEKKLPPAARDLLFAAAVMYLDDIDFNKIFSDALLEVKPSFWSKKLDQLTPLEWKLLAALEDESFKAQVKDLIEGDIRT